MAAAPAAPSADVTFEFRVGPPQQRNGATAFERPFRTFPIKWRTTSPAFTQKTGDVLRRYSHFEWLRNELRILFPFCIIPPIPEKDVQGSVEKFVATAANDTFLEYRSRALRKFLLRTSSCLQLAHSAVFIQFLTLDEAQWDLVMKAPRGKAPVAAVATTSDEAQATAAAAAAPAIWGSAVPGQTGALGPAVALPSNPQVWEEIKLYITQLDESIRTLRERLEVLAKRRRATGGSLMEFGRAFSQVGDMEKNIEQQETALSNAVLLVGRHSQDLAGVYAEHADQETKQVIETLLYYSGMCASVRETLGHVAQVLTTRDKAAANAKEMVQARDKLMAKAPAPDKVAKAEADLQQAVDAHRRLQADAAIGEAVFREELRRFHREKQYDMKALLKKFIELQMDYAAKMRRQWETVMPAVEEVRL